MILLVNDELELKCLAASLGIGNLYRDILPSSDNSGLEAVKEKISDLQPSRNPCSS